MPDDDLAPDFAALAAEARRLEPRVVRAWTHTDPDYQTTLAIETEGLTRTEVDALTEALRVFVRRKDLAVGFGSVNTAGGEFMTIPAVPKGWPP